MNGFADRNFAEEDFAEPKGLSIKTFDAFPKTKPTYLTRSRTGSAWTLLLIVASVSLILSETRRWFAGTTRHAFTVEKGISHDLQLNLDVVVAMKCEDVHINIQDAAGDRVLAGELLKKDQTQWRQWLSGKRGRGKTSFKSKEGQWGDESYFGLGEDEDVHDYLGAARKKRKFPKTPRLSGEGDSCRIWGSIEGNKVQGDFHITARGHGYMEFAPHLEHDKFNFSHIINELSFGPFFPGLDNPLDSTVATTPFHFYRFQYYANIVPTIYTEDVDRLTLSPPKTRKHHGTDAHRVSHENEPMHNVDAQDASNAFVYSPSTVFTNQYAVTEQSHAVGENMVPGIFLKYDIEPILLLVSEEWGGLLALIVRLINVVSGVLVAGTWCWQLTDWAMDVWGKNKGRERLGFLGTRDEKAV